MYVCMNVICMNVCMNVIYMYVCVYAYMFMCIHVCMYRGHWISYKLVGKAKVIN